MPDVCLVTLKRQDTQTNKQKLYWASCTTRSRNQSIFSSEVTILWCGCKIVWYYFNLFFLSRELQHLGKNLGVCDTRQGEHSQKNNIHGTAPFHTSYILHTRLSRTLKTQNFTQHDIPCTVFFHTICHFVEPADVMRCLTRHTRGFQNVKDPRITNDSWTERVKLTTERIAFTTNVRYLHRNVR